MPELPEVEIVRESLDKTIKQKKVKKVIIRNRNLRFKIPSNFENLLKNQKIVKVKRFSKYLILGLSNKSYCLLHLGVEFRPCELYDLLLGRQLGERHVVRLCPYVLLPLLEPVPEVFKPSFCRPGCRARGRKSRDSTDC